MPCVAELERLTGASAIHLSQCQYGGQAQKHTTLLCSPALEPYVGDLQRLCHGGHSHEGVAAGYDAAGRSRSARAAAYPSDLNTALAAAFAAWLQLSPME
jgi:hypothetical protein